MNLIFVPKCSPLNKLSNGILTSSTGVLLCQIHSKMVGPPSDAHLKNFFESVDSAECPLFALWLDEYH